MSNHKKFDVIIIGAGGTGMSAAIYTTRYNLSTLILTKDLGGQAALTEVIENYPGFESIGGIELMEQFKKHCEKFGAVVVFDPVTKIVQRDDKNFFVTTNGEKTYEAKAVIIASGLEHRKLGVPGEEKFEGKGVAYCATCDAPLYRGKNAVVVGGGNSALEAVEALARVGAVNVYGAIRDGAYKGEAIMIKKVEEYPNIEKIFNTELIEVIGDTFVTAAVLRDRTSGITRNLRVDGVFVAIGWTAKTEWLGELVDREKNGELLVGISGETKTPGLFAAGDITKLPTKQLVVSAGEGVKAALAAFEYIRSHF